MSSRGGARYGAVGAAGAAVLGSLLRTTRIEFLDRDLLEDTIRVHGGAIVALWHGDLLVPTWAYRHRNFVTMASRSADGEYIARVLDRWGYSVARGSSSRGGDSALREMAELVRQGHSAALTADGPRGPRHRLKRGVLHLARLTGRPVVPVAAAAARAWIFGSWDRFTLPKPFSRVVIAIGEPVTVEPDADAAALEPLARHIEASMAELGRRAARVAGAARAAGAAEAA
jgi:lysophospholipid acyltransferase (LPLAT)-like uncharacterized protein